MSRENIPLSLMLENAKKNINVVINQAIEESGLPAYLLEGIVVDLLSEIRKQKNLELLADISAASKKEEEVEE